MHLCNVYLKFILALRVFFADKLDQLVVFNREIVIGYEILFRSLS
jgi:hypothetical protein